MMAQRTTTPMAPSETEQWDRRIGAQWAALLRSEQTDPAGTIVEAAPGYAVKIGVGLRAYGFRGVLFVIEPGEAARAWILKRYRELLPLARIVPVDVPIALAAAAIPRHVDAVLMNHVLDDFVLNESLPTARRGSVFEQMVPGAPCPAEVRRVWDGLSSDPEALAPIGERVIDDICSFCGAVGPMMLGISQYQSWFHAHHGLAAIDRLTAPLLPRLADRLAAAGIAWDVELLGHGEPERRWLVARRLGQTGGQQPWIASTDESHRNGRDGC